ncbi:MAG TPA: hypothetical protein VEB41_01425 [Burkholderiales bacterium]|nr:hypothetical protein [Burkholderiales bacterium]
MPDPNAICSVEVGLLRKKPCGHPAVVECSNCQQPLCTQHAVPELSGLGKKTGKFLCQECQAAAKEQAKALAAVARAQEEKKKVELAKSVMQGSAAAPKKPAAPGAPAAGAPATPGAKPAEPAAKEPDALEFTPKDGDLSYKRKTDG